MKVLTATIGVSMMLFVAVTAWPAHTRWAKDEPRWVLVLSELALFYTGLDALMNALIS